MRTYILTIVDLRQNKHITFRCQAKSFDEALASVERDFPDHFEALRNCFAEGKKNASVNA